MTTQLQTVPKRAKFVELANKRVNNALKAIGLIGNLSSHSSYDYTKADITKIFQILEKQIKTVRYRFDDTKKTDRNSFNIIE
jgi:Domain of unknown function (DUF4145)